MNTLALKSSNIKHSKRIAHSCYMQECKGLAYWPHMFCDKCLKKEVVIEI